MLIDLRSNHLPWNKAIREDRILYLKESVSDKQLLSIGKMEFYEQILTHLRKLRYPDRPDYRYMYKLVSAYDRFLKITTMKKMHHSEVNIKKKNHIFKIIHTSI